MKSRRATVTLEMETGESFARLRSGRLWQRVLDEHFGGIIAQVHVNVVRPERKSKPATKAKRR